MAKPNVTRTFGPIHFEDLDPHRFEDLIRQLAYDFRQWQSIESTGRGGADDDIDDNAPPGASSSSDTADGIHSVVADKGYSKAEVLRELKESGFRTYIPERRQKGTRKWTDKGGRKTAAAFYENRARVGRKKGKALQRKRGELVERTFAHIWARGHIWILRICCYRQLVWQLL